MVLPGSSCTVAWIGSSLGEASFTPAPFCSRICLGPNSSHSSNPSVATISTFASEILGIRLLLEALQEPARFTARLCLSTSRVKALLRHSSDNEPGIHRQRIGRAWAYFDPQGDRVTDRAEVDRLNA